jgi:hypothetical protein
MTVPQGNPQLPLPDDADLAHDQPQGVDADESENEDFNNRYGTKVNHDAS